MWVKRHDDLSNLITNMNIDYAGWADKIKGDAYPPEDGFYKIVEQKPV